MQMKQLKLEISKKHSGSLKERTLSTTKHPIKASEGKGMIQEAGPHKKQALSKDGERVAELRRQASPSSVGGDDVVHCLCGSEVDEGFMIQVGVATGWS